MLNGIAKSNPFRHLATKPGPGRGNVRAAAAQSEFGGGAAANPGRARAVCGRAAGHPGAAGGREPGEARAAGSAAHRCPESAESKAARPEAGLRKINRRLGFADSQPDRKVCEGAAGARGQKRAGAAGASRNEPAALCQRKRPVLGSIAGAQKAAEVAAAAGRERETQCAGVRARPGFAARESIHSRAANFGVGAAARARYGA